MRRVFAIVKSGVFGAALVIAGFAGGCDSAEKYQKQAPQVQQAPEPTAGEIALKGTPEELAFARDLAEALDAARLKFDLRDTTGAIVVADSLAQVALTAIDTLPADHGLNGFLTIYIADAYGTLQEWHRARGDDEAVADFQRRYNELTQRLQQRRDTLQTQEP
jgi:hypothetical protein